MVSDDLDDSPTHVVLSKLADLEYRIEQIERFLEVEIEIGRRETG